MPSLSGRPIFNIEQSRGYVWDTGTLDWIPAEPSGGPGGSGTEYTEDAAAAANPVGPAVILVRADTPAATVSTDGDNIAQRGTNFGAAYVTLLDAAGSPVAVGGGTQYTEDAAAAANPVGTALIGVRADALAGVTSTDGDNVAARMTDKGELYVKHADAIAVTNAGLTALNGAIAGTEVQVDVLSSALPTGAATAANQTTGNTSLATIAGAVSGTEMQVDVLTSALPTGAATSAKQDTQIAAEQAIQTAVELLDNTVATLGTTTYTEATSQGLIIGAVRRDADTTLVNTTNEIGPLQMDANGRLKVEAFSGETLPVSLTSTTITGTVATKEGRSGTGTITSVNDTAVSTTLLASNANRLGGSIYNDSTVALYAKCGATASTTSFTVIIQPNGYWEIPFHYTGIIDGIWASDASGAARITEYT